MDHKLDQTGKIADDDAIYTTLDDCFDREDYRGIADTITAIPREIWSTKLWFRLISAYNNLREFDNAFRELHLIEPYCVTDDQKASRCYMYGYAYYADDKEMMAVSCFSDGKKIDPEDKGDHEWDRMIAECSEYIKKSLEKLRALAEHIDEDITDAFSQQPEEDRDEVSEEEFTMFLGYIPAIRKIPGTSKGLLFDKENYFLKYKGDDKKAVLEFFDRMYGVHDRESFRDMFTTYTGCNIINLYGDIPPYLAGEPNFDTDELNDQGREAFFNAVEFFKPFNEFLPEAGVLAWDICEKVGLARLAYSCDIIGNTDYCTIMLMLTDQAREQFSDFEEYMRSLIFGCGVYMFHTGNWDINGAMDFMKMIMPMLLKSDLPYIQWQPGDEDDDEDDEDDE